MTLENESPPISDAPVTEDGKREAVHGAPSGEAGPMGRAGLRRRRLKRLSVGVLGVISLWLALKWAYPVLSIHLESFGRSHKRDVGVRPEDYESIAPFFIPMPSGRDKVAARVNLRVKWDRLTGARFKRDAVLIRQRIYLYLREMEQWSEDMAANRQVLEEGIGRILRQTLGVKDVDVLVEDVHYVHIEAHFLPCRQMVDIRRPDRSTQEMIKPQA